MCLQQQWFFVFGISNPNCINDDVITIGCSFSLSLSQWNSLQSGRKWDRHLLFSAERSTCVYMCPWRWKLSTMFMIECTDECTRWMHKTNKKEIKTWFNLIYIACLARSPALVSLFYCHWRASESARDCRSWVGRPCVCMCEAIDKSNGTDRRRDERLWACRRNVLVGKTMVAVAWKLETCARRSTESGDDPLLSARV